MGVLGRCGCNREGERETHACEGMGKWEVKWEGTGRVGRDENAFNNVYLTLYRKPYLTSTSNLACLRY